MPSDGDRSSDARMPLDESEVAAALREVAANARGSVGERARLAAELIRAATKRRWVGIYRVTDSQVKNIAWSGVGPPAHPAFDVDRGLTAIVLATGQTVVSNDVAADPRYLTNQPTSGSELIAPIVLAGRVVGSLDVEDPSTAAFDADDRRLFERLAAALVALYEAA
jgi:GAF domain-containing protein